MPIDETGYPKTPGLQEAAAKVTKALALSEGTGLIPRRDGYKNFDLLFACREIIELFEMFELAIDLTANDLNDHQYTMLEDVQAFAETRLNQRCDTLRAAIIKGTI